MSVYFIRATKGIVKISSAADPVRRLSFLKTGNHLDLKLVAVMPGGPTEERALHKKFKMCRIKREWFKETEAISALIKKWPFVPQRKRPEARFSGEVGKLLVTTRLAKNINQAEIGKMLGISQSMISKIESGRAPSKPVLMLLEQLAAQ